MAKLIGD